MHHNANMSKINSVLIQTKFVLYRYFWLYVGDSICCHLQRGATPALYISLKKGVSFKTSADQRFVKQGYFLCRGTK